jgi:hypothetical protein
MHRDYRGRTQRDDHPSERRGVEEIRPIIRRDPEAYRTLRSATSIYDIDDFVLQVLKGHFERILGYVPPILLSNNQQAMRTLRRSKTDPVTPVTLPSAVWNFKLNGFHGQTSDIRANFISFKSASEIPGHKIGDISIVNSVPFHVGVTLASRNGDFEGYFGMKFLLYIEFPVQSIRTLQRETLAQALTLYNGDSSLFLDKKVVYLGYTPTRQIRELKDRSREETTREERMAAEAQREALRDKFLRDYEEYVQSIKAELAQTAMAAQIYPSR